MYDDDDNDSAADADMEPDTGDATFRADEAPRFTAPCRLHFHHVRKRLADVMSGMCGESVDVAAAKSALREGLKKVKDELTRLGIGFVERRNQ